MIGFSLIADHQVIADVEVVTIIRIRKFSDFLLVYQALVLSRFCANRGTENDCILKNRGAEEKV